MRKPNDMSDVYDKKDTDKPVKNDDRATANLLAFPLRLASSHSDDVDLDTKARPRDVAEYIAEMLQSLENLALKNRLDVLGLMIAMAREQANDDIRDNGTD